MPNNDRFNVIVTEPYSKEGLAILQGCPKIDLNFCPKISYEELSLKIPHADVLLVRSQTVVDGQLIALGSKLKIIGRAGVGLDNIDLKASAQKNIKVLNTPTGNSIAAAEHTFALLLNLARNVTSANQDIKAGNWNRHLFVGQELDGKTLGLIGFGHVGRLVCARALAFGMKVYAFDPLIDESIFTSHNAIKEDLQNLLKKADILSLHCPLNQHTNGILDQKAFLSIKPGCILLNTARGGLIDKKALISALDSGIVSKAAIDVFDQEPTLLNDPLVNHPQVLATPHLAASTREAQSKVSVMLSMEVVRLLK